MPIVKALFPKISRPGEYVAFLVFRASTLEGPAYLFMACDGYSEFAFQMNVERDESPASVIKAVRMLTKDKDFALHMHKGFTLVFDRFEELEEQIKAVLKPVNGKVLFHKAFHKKIAAPLVKEMGAFLKGRR